MRPKPALVAALTGSVLPSGLGVAASDPACIPDVICSEEEQLVIGAVARRKTEFHAGRTAARAAMAELSLPPRKILMGLDRAPIWPVDITGSISHSANACAAAVGFCDDWASIGIDLEEATPLDPLLVVEICTKAERQWLGRQPANERGVMAKLIFSAKEAVYKAQYPLTQLLFGFDALELKIDRANSQFEASFQTSQGQFETGSILTGSYAHAAGLLVTGVAIGHSEKAGRNNSM